VSTEHTGRTHGGAVRPEAAPQASPDANTIAAVHDRVVTIREVARQAGVSPATVSNVLNTPSIVADGTRRRVEQAIAELGFVRNHSARQLRNGRSVAIGLVVLAFDDFFSELARGVEEVARETGCLVIVCNSDGDARKEERYLRLLAEQRVRGVLVSPLRADAPHLRRLDRFGLPHVRLVGDADGSSGHPEVGGDFVRDAELAVGHLLSLGHTRLALVNGPATIEACAQRRAGAARALARAGLDEREALVELVAAGFDVHSGEAAARRLLELRPRPTAVLGVNDLLAVGVLGTALAAGLAVPGDLAVMGVGDIEFAAVSAVPLTSIRYPAYEIGRTAAELLLRGGDRDASVVRFEPQLVVRASTAGGLTGGAAASYARPA
jgi:LacI family transcriptional regulator